MSVEGEFNVNSLNNNLFIKKKDEKDENYIREIISKNYLIKDLIKDFDVESKENKIEIYFTPLNVKDAVEILFCDEDYLNLNNFNYQHRYYGSSTRLGESFEIFNAEFGYKYMKFKIKINNILVLEENINFKILNKEYLKAKSYNYCENSIEEIKNSIESEKSCIFNSFTNILIKDKYIDIKFSFRDLHRFEYAVELCGIDITLT